MKLRYLTRQSHGLVILQGPEETYSHEDGEHNGTGRQLDLGDICNQMLEKAEGLRKEARVPENNWTSQTLAELKNSQASVLEAQAALIVAENDLQTDPLASSISHAELRAALVLAAKALNIASEWHVENVQINPPAEWCLTANGENTQEGWCSTNSLAKKLNQLAEMRVE